MAAKSEGRKRVRLQYHAPHAREVVVVGTFNGWDAASLKKTKDGVWTKSVLVSPGRHEYKFLVDGEWHVDPAGAETAPNPFGTRNSVIRVVQGKS